jgi:hypothetical protein
MNTKENKESLFKQMYVTQTLGFIDISKKRPFWSELANELNGIFKIKQTISKDLELLFLQIPYQEFNIEFTESDTHPLKINCIIKIKQKIEFSLTYEDSIEKLFKLFGKQDINLKDDVFDKKYLIQGQNTEIIKNILSITNIKNILLKNNVFSFMSTYQKKESTIILTSLVSRTINSKSELLDLYKLFCLTIDKLKELEYI